MSQINEITFISIVIKAKSGIKYILHKWYVIGLVSLVSSIGGITYAWLEKPKYHAELIFSAESGGDNKLGSYGSIAAQFGFDLGNSGGSVFQGDNLMELLRTRNLISKTLYSKNPYSKNELMIETYVKVHKIAKATVNGRPLNTINYKDTTLYDRTKDSITNKVVEKIIKDQLIIDKKDKKLSFISATMIDNDEFFAKNFIELLAQNAIEYFISYRTKKSSQNVEVLQVQADSVKKVLFGGIVNIAASNDLNINPIRQISKTSSQKKQVDVQVANAVYVEIVKNLELAKLNLLKETPLIQIIDTPVLPLKKEKHGRLLTGLFFGIVGFVLVILFLLIQKWITNGFLANLKELETKAN